MAYFGEEMDVGPYGGDLYGLYDFDDPYLEGNVSIGFGGGFDNPLFGSDRIANLEGILGQIGARASEMSGNLDDYGDLNQIGIFDPEYSEIFGNRGS